MRSSNFGGLPLDMVLGAIQWLRRSESVLIFLNTQDNMKVQDAVQKLTTGLFML